MPMSVQAGGITLCSHDYPAGPAAAAGRRSRSRRRRTSRRSPSPSRSRSPTLSAKAPQATRTSELAASAEPASSSHVEASSPPSSALPSGMTSAASSASKRPSKWTIPQWARKAINKRVREKQVNQAKERLPSRPQGKSIWFVPDDIDEPAMSRAGSSRSPRAEEPAQSDGVDSAAAAYRSVACDPLPASQHSLVGRLLHACLSYQFCLTALHVPLPSPRFGEAGPGLHWSAAVAHSALVSCVRIGPGCLGACSPESGPLGIELPNWLLEGMPNLWPGGSSPWPNREVLCFVKPSRPRRIHVQINTCLTGLLPQMSAMHNARLQLQTACIWPVPLRAALLSLRLDLSWTSRSRPPLLLCVRRLLHLKQAPIRYCLITWSPPRLLSSSTFALWTDVPRPRLMHQVLYRRGILPRTSSVSVSGSAVLSVHSTFPAGPRLKHTFTLHTCGVGLVQGISILARPPWASDRQRRLAASDQQRTLHLHHCRNGPPGRQASSTLWTASSILQPRTWRRWIPVTRPLGQDVEAPAVASKAWRIFTIAVKRKDLMMMMMMIPFTEKLQGYRQWRIPQPRTVPWPIVIELSREATRGGACLHRHHQLLDVQLLRQNPLTPLPRLRHSIHLLSAGLNWALRTSTHSVTFRWVWFFAPRRLISSVLDEGSSPHAVRNVGLLQHLACAQNLCSLLLCFLLPLTGTDPHRLSCLPTDISGPTLAAGGPAQCSSHFVLDLCSRKCSTVASCQPVGLVGAFMCVLAVSSM